MLQRGRDREAAIQVCCSMAWTRCLLLPYKPKRQEQLGTNVRTARDTGSRPSWLLYGQDALGLNESVLAVCSSPMPKKLGLLGCSQQSLEMASGTPYQEAQYRASGTRAMTVRPQKQRNPTWKRQETSTALTGASTERRRGLVFPSENPNCHGRMDAGLHSWGRLRDTAT